MSPVFEKMAEKGALGSPQGLLIEAGWRDMTTDFDQRRKRGHFVPAPGGQMS